MGIVKINPRRKFERQGLRGLSLTKRRIWSDKINKIVVTEHVSWAQNNALSVEVLLRVLTALPKPARWIRGPLRRWEGLQRIIETHHITAVEYTENVFAAAALPQTPLGKLTSCGDS